MRSQLSKAAVLAAAAITLGALASPTGAKTYTFTFATPSGSPYCDGITLSNGGSGDGWSGDHIGACITEAPAEEFTAKIGGTTYLDIAMVNYETNPASLMTLLMVPKTKLWYLYGTINDGAGGLLLINEGMLLKGAPPTAKSPGARPSTVRNPKAIDKPVF